MTVRSILVSVIFLVIISVNTEDIKDLNLNQLLQLAQDVSQVRIGDLNDEDITYFLFTRNSKSGIIIDNITKGSIDISKPTKFIIHGWIATSRRSWTKVLTDEFLKNGDFNVIQVDWERPARSSYISAAVDTKVIGHRIAHFICGVGFSVNNVHLVGHSLGAHIAGFTAKKIKELTGNKVGRISGLDPAGPYFVRYISLSEERLDKDDAAVVDIIHTDAGASGIELPIGTLDIFVNGGRAPQPGCVENFKPTSVGNILEHSYCSHEISITYFTEWINSGKFHCVLCSLRQDFLVGNCIRTLSIGEDDVDENVTGICFAKTHLRRPFLYN